MAEQITEAVKLFDDGLNTDPGRLANFPAGWQSGLVVADKMIGGTSRLSPDCHLAKLNLLQTFVNRHSNHEKRQITANNRSDEIFP